MCTGLWHDGSGSTVNNRIHRILRQTGRAILLTGAFLYFLIDLIFFSIVRPLRRRLMALKWVKGLREWVSTLHPYSALLLLLVPWLILEPIKPIGFLLLAHQHHLAATLLIVVGEVVKLTLFEQLLDMTRPKLMNFRWFAWSYNKWRAATTCGRYLCGVKCSIGIELFGRGCVAAGSSPDDGSQARFAEGGQVR